MVDRRNCWSYLKVSRSFPCMTADSLKLNLLHCMELASNTYHCHIWSQVMIKLGCAKPSNIPGGFSLWAGIDNINIRE